MGKETLTHWMALAAEGRVDERFESEMVRHYDPCYQQSTRRNYGQRPEASDLQLASLGPAGLAEAVRLLVEVDTRQSAGALIDGQ